jgi:hypothetical protein
MNVKSNPSNHLEKFYKHGQGLLDFLGDIDYSELSRARDVLKGLDNAIPQEFHDQIKQTVVDRLKQFYQIGIEYLKDKSPSEVRIIDELAVRQNVKALLGYGIKRKEDAQGHPKPYNAPKQDYATALPDAA